MIPGPKILILSGLGTKNIDLQWSGDRKYYFSVVQGQKTMNYWPGDRQSHFEWLHPYETEHEIMQRERLDVFV